MGEHYEFPEPTLKRAAPIQKPAAESSAQRLEIYKMLVEMADRVSQRRQAANNFYLSANTLLVGGTAILDRIGLRNWNVIVVALAGLSICALWIRSIGSYASLNEGKFAVITEIEADFAVQPFSREWAVLHPPENAPDEVKKKRHHPFHKVEVWIPWVFIALYGIQIAAHVPWRAAWVAIARLI